MAGRKRLNANFGVTNLPRGNVYPSDPDFLSSVRKQTKAITDALLNIFQQFEDASPDIMIDALKPTLEKARDVYCPMRTGALRESAYLLEASFRGHVRVEIGFARGGSPPYAIWVHEMLFNHEPPTRYKFLQQAVTEDLGDIYARLGAGYANFMGSR